jgi:hypothetical protein
VESGQGRQLKYRGSSGSGVKILIVRFKNSAYPVEDTSKSIKVSEGVL